MKRAILAIAWIVGVGYARADDWPQWRGPTRNGLTHLSPRLAESFGDASLVWRSESLESGERGGRGSVAVADGKVFGLTRVASSTGSVDQLFCLDASNGETIWKTALAGATGEDPPSSTPCVEGDRLWIANMTNRVHCLDVTDGDEIWNREIERRKPKSVASSIVKLGGSVFLLADGLIALDADSGETRWRRDDIDGFQSSPSSYVLPDGSPTLICNERIETSCVDASDGTTLWTIPGGGLSTPVVAYEYGGDFLAVLSKSRKHGLTAYRLRGRAAPQKLWTQRVFDRGSSPVVHNGHVYAIAGGSAGHDARAMCVHLDSGTVAWDESIGFAEISSPIVVDDKVIAVCGSLVRIIAATPERFTDFGATDCRVTLCTSPAVSRGRLILRRPNGVVCYDLRADSE